MKKKYTHVVLCSALAVPAAALMLGSAEASSTVALNFQSWYYDSGATPQTVGFGNGYQTTGFPVTAKAFGVDVANWTNTDPIQAGTAISLTDIPFAGLTVDLNSTNLWQTGYIAPGIQGPSLGVSWPENWLPGADVKNLVTPGNYEVTWSVVDNTGWDFTLNGLNAKFPSGYMVGLITGNNTKTTSSVEITDPDTNSLGTVTFSVLPDTFGVGASSVLTNDSITFTNLSRNVSTSTACSLAGVIVTDKPVVTSCFPTNTLVATGASFTLKGTALGIGTLSYQWKRNGTNIPGAAAQSINYTVPAASAADNGTYTLVVSSSSYPSSPATSESVSVSVVPPQPVTWDGDTATTGAQNGTGSWNTTTANWWNGTSDVVWNQINPATFGSGGTSPYTVSLTENISAQGGIVFNSGAYTISPAASQTLNLAGPQTITTNVDATIAASLTGANGFTKAGAGKLTLSASNNPITGPVVVNAGTLSLSKGGGGTSLTVNPGATATTTVAGSIGYGTSCYVLNVNGGTFNLGAPDNGIWSMDTTLQNATLTAVPGANWSYGGSNSKITNSGTSTISGGLFIIRDSLPSNTLPIINNGDFTFNCPIDGWNNLLNISGTGTTRIANTAQSISNVTLAGGTLEVTGRLTTYGVNVSDGATLSVASAGSVPVVNALSSIYVGNDPSGPTGTNTLNFKAVTSTTTAPIQTGSLSLYNPVTINVQAVASQVGQYPLIFVPNGGYFSTDTITLGTLPAGITATLVNDLENSGTIYLDVTDVNISSIDWTGAVNGVWDINTTNNWTPAKYTEGTAVNFADGATNTSVTLGISVSPASVSFDNYDDDYTLTGSGGLSGAAGLTKSGTGNLLITTNNTNAGDVSISGGGTVTVGTGGTSGKLGGAGNINLDSSTLVFNKSDAVTLVGTVTGLGGTVVQNGSGSLTMSAPNNTSDIVVNSGTLIASGGSFGAGFASGKTITVNSGATLATSTHTLGSAVGGGGDVPAIVLNGGNWLLGAEQYIRSVTMTAGSTTGTPTKDGIRTLSGSVFTINAAATSSTIGSPLNLVNDLSLVVNDGAATDDLVISGIISSTKSITKSGDGRVLLSGVNTYTGTTTVTGGTLAVNGTSIADTNTLVISGGKVDVTGNETVNALNYGATPQAPGTYGSTASSATNKDDTKFSGTGILTVLTGPVSGFTGWAATNAPGQTISQDHDGDGVSNGIEYFMGLSGSGFTANPGVVAGKVSWPKGASYSGTYGTDYVVQTSTDLATWTPVSQSEPNLSNVNPLQYTLPVGNQKIFVRLKVTGP